MLGATTVELCLNVAALITQTALELAVMLAVPAFGTCVHSARLLLRFEANVNPVPALEVPPEMIVATASSFAVVTLIGTESVPERPLADVYASSVAPLTSKAYISMNGEVPLRLTITDKAPEAVGCVQAAICCQLMSGDVTTLPRMVYWLLSVSATELSEVPAKSVTIQIASAACTAWGNTI